MAIRNWLQAAEQLLGILSIGNTPRPKQRARFSRHRACQVESLENRSVLAAGALDTTLDGNGKKLVGFSSDDQASAVAVAGDNKIVMVGATKISSTNYNFAITRLSSAGVLDTTFSGDGKMTIDFGSTRIDRAYAVKIISGNKILVVGESIDSSGNGDFAIARINANGTLDTSFSGDGRARVGWGGNERAYGVELGETDGYLIVGSAKGSKDVDFAVARLNNAGNLDTRFSSDGKHLYNFTGRNDTAIAIVKDRSGGYVVGGTTLDSSKSGDFGLVRIRDNGSVNTAFSGDGFQRIGFNAHDSLSGLQYDSATGRIVAAGQSRTNTSGDYKFAVARVTLGGSFDTSFSGDGKLLISYSGYNTRSSVDVRVDSAGRIYVSGTVRINGNTNFGLIRLTRSGNLDNTFSGDGKTNAGMDSDSVDFANGLTFDNQGRILVAGHAKLTPSGTTYDFGVIRFLTS